MKQGLGRISRCAIVLLVPTAVALSVLWIPFGFSMVGLVEEWDLLGLFTMHGTFLTIHLDGPLPAHALRPLMPLSFGLAHLASPDSFLAWHLITIAALLAKGAAMTYMIRHATDSWRWGVLAAVLLLLYPADTMQLSLRAIHINVALAAALVSAALMVRALDSESRANALLMALVASVLNLAAAGIYEAVMTLLPLPIFISCVAHWRQWRGRLKRSVMPLVIWVANLVVYVVYGAWISSRISSYQGSVTGDKSALIATLSQTWSKLFTVGASRALFGGWCDAAAIAMSEFSSFTYLFGAAAAVAAAGWLCVWLAPKRTNFTSWRWAGDERGRCVRLIIFGLLVMLAGYAPFLISVSHISVSQRTFLWATPGAVMVWVGVLGLLAGWLRLLAWGPALVMLVIGLASQLYQFHHYDNLSDRQRDLLRATVEKLGQEPSRSKTYVVLDGTSQIGNAWMFVNGDSFRYALSYLYGYTVGPVEVCRAPSMEWQRVDAVGRKGKCARDSTGWSFEPGPPVKISNTSEYVPDPGRHVAFADAIEVAIGEGGAIADGPSSPALSGTIARRYHGVVGQRESSVVGPMFVDQKVRDRYRWDFGRWWNLDDPPRGAGWRDAEWTGNGMGHRSSAWQVREGGELFFEINPVPSAYRLRASYDLFANEQARLGLRVLLNGREFSPVWVSGQDFEIELPVGQLKNGTNHLEFRTDSDDGRFGISAHMDWVEISPEK